MSSYLDFSNPATRAWYSRCFSLDKYKVCVFFFFFVPLTSPWRFRRSNPVSVYCLCLNAGVHTIFVCVERHERTVCFRWTGANDAEGHGASWRLGTPGYAQPVRLPTGEQAPNVKVWGQIRLCLIFHFINFLQMFFIVRVLKM